LVDLLDEDYRTQMDLVEHAVNGIASVFELQSPTPKNDFCRMFIREGLLDPLTSALVNVSDQDEIHTRIASILLVFTQVSQSDVHVRAAIGTRQIIRRESSLLKPNRLTDHDLHQDLCVLANSPGRTS